MEKGFLEILAGFLRQKYPEGMDNFCFLFPNHRSMLFFKNYLQKSFDNPVWMPEMHSISDFMTSVSGMEMADPLELVFEIYDSYCSLTDNPESFDEFFHWGEMMISDFDDLDKYMVDPEMLFRNIVDLKEIDTVFDYMTEEQKQLVRRFWKSFHMGQLSDEKESFLRMWKILFPVYLLFNKKLNEKKIAYEGMIYRKVADLIHSDQSPEFRWDKVIVIGFNALSKAEQLIFDFLRNSGKGEFYWDYDVSYTADPHSEAGRFLRDNLERYPHDTAFDAGFNLLSKKRNIRVYSLPSDVLQAKQLYKLLEEREDGNINHLNDTAVILGDESMLPVMLSSLPDRVENLNITMGYPLSQTPVFSFIDNILNLQMRIAGRSKASGFYYRDVLSVLNHQYIQSLNSDEPGRIIDDIHRRNRIYIPAPEFENDPVLSRIFRHTGTAALLLDYLLELVNSLLDLVRDRGGSFNIEAEYIYIIRTRLVKLMNIFSAKALTDSMESIIRLLRKVLSGSSIPFRGEPLRGLQVMGILESRLLDFKNVYITSLNEGVMPAVSRSSSYVPSGLRYAFGMPGREDKDAIYAYYFFRLLQRSENVTLLYNSKTEGLVTGEPSRYIYQLDYLMGQDISYITPSFMISPSKKDTIRIEKTAEVKERLKRFTDPEGKDYLSPSALSSWLDCSLKFYFTYIAGLREEDEASEEIDASGFGTLYHKTMELLYHPFTAKEITEDIIRELKRPEKIKENLDEAFRIEFLKSRDKDSSEFKPEGRNIIVYEIIFRMVDRTLHTDMGVCPFIYVGSEIKTECFSDDIEYCGKVHLGGKIDRLDRRKEILNILDYKTGKASLDFPSLDKVFDRDNWGSGNYKGIFQTMLYAWLYNRTNPGEQVITPGIYHAGSLFEKDFSIHLVNKNNGPVLNYFEYADEYSQRLEDLIQKIFDPATGFEQTSDTKRCSWCPYTGICHR